MSSTNTVVQQLAVRIAHYLDQLDAAGQPGSVIAAAHRDSHGVRKVIITVEEVWPISRESE